MPSSSAFQDEQPGGLPQQQAGKTSIARHYSKLRSTVTSPVLIPTNASTKAIFNLARSKTSPSGFQLGSQPSPGSTTGFVAGSGSGSSSTSPYSLSSLNSSVDNVFKTLFRKTRLLSNDQQLVQTEGPITKNFDDVTSPTSSANSLYDPVDSNSCINNIFEIDELSLSDAVGADSIPSNGSSLPLAHRDPSPTEFEAPEVPKVLVESGLPLLRITHKKKVHRVFKIDIDNALLYWNNKSSSRMSLDKIQQIKISQDAKNYREEYKISKEHAEKWATIIYNDIATDKLKALHIIASSPEDFQLFISTLTNLVNKRRELMKLLSISSDHFAKIHWKNYILKDCTRIEKKELLSFDDVVKLTTRLHINIDINSLHEIFNQNDLNMKGFLNFTEFQRFVKVLKTRSEIVTIFNDLVRDNDTLSYETFESFLINVQKMNNNQTILKIFEKFSAGKSFLSFDDFNNYITSTYCSALQKSSLEDNDEYFSKPINEYFISSSHNTYLLGRQVGGSSSIEAYTKALQRGCRSIEIDIWDGDQGPVVSHGRTFTSSVNLIDVLENIRKYAFIVTPFPLILSLEVHCKAEYQLVIVEQLKDIFGESLVTERINLQNFKLPSPLELKHRILVKVKKTKENSSLSNRSFSSTNEEFMTTTTTTSGGEEIIEKDTKKVTSTKKYKTKIIPELSALGVYMLGLKFINFSLPESKTFNHIFSFSEKSFNSMIKDSEKNYLINKHNRSYLMRVYPSGMRYNSSNFNPIQFWKAGVQMVATNWQTFDEGQLINEAMFNNSSSKSGYVLKPESLRNVNPNSKFRLLHNLNQNHNQVIKFSIEIISAQYLPRPKELKQEDSFDPYMVFEIIDPKLVEGELQVTDLNSNRTQLSNNGIFTTRAIKANGFNPIYNYRIEGKIIDNNGLNFLKIVLKTGEIQFAVFCCKLDQLQQGYRHLPLYDFKGEEYIFSTLFIKFDYEQPT